MIVVALDYGRQRVGIAVADSLGVVMPVAVVVQRSRDETIRSIIKQLTDLRADRLIVGHPLNMNGVAGRAATAAARFADELRAAAGLPVELYDERLTSFEARDRLRALAGRGKRRGLDAVAACVILESWLRDRHQ